MASCARWNPPLYQKFTMTHNSAKRLTQMANSAQGTTVTFAYDAWGRTTSKTLGAKTAEYAYRYGARLHAVTSDFFDEGNVRFEYGGDGRRRSAAAGVVTMRYRWDAGWNMINEEDGNGTLTRTYWHHPQAGDEPFGIEPRRAKQQKRRIRSASFIHVHAFN